MEFISFIGKRLPLKAATTHFCFIGATGSGKTVSVRILMQSAFPLIGEGYGHRALVYDAKRDMMPILSGIVDPRLITTLNPFDVRSVAWDMAQDIRTPANALQLATILIPVEKNASQPFFGDAARHLLTALIIAFIRMSDEREARGESRIPWTFRDVIWTMLHKDALVEVLKQAKETSYIADLYFSHEGTAQNIMSTVATKLNAYSIIAALWHRAFEEGRKISLTDWVKSESILVLGNEHTNRAAVDAINQVIFKRLSEIILDQEDIPQNRNGIDPRTWIIFDEFVRAGKLEGMVELTTEGRSKGAAVVLGFQDIEGARAVYGKEVAEEIIGQCSNIAILRLQSPETAEWASRLFGSHEKLEEEYSENEGESDNLGVFGLLNKGNTKGSSTTWRKQIRQAVLSSEFLNLPVTDSTNGIRGFLFSPFFADKKYLQDHSVPANKLFPGLCDKDELVPGVKRRDGSQQFLEDLGKDDWQRLGLLNVYRTIEASQNETAEEKRRLQIERLAGALFEPGMTEEERQQIASLDDEERAIFNQAIRRAELEKWEKEEEEKQVKIKALAALWIRRNQTAKELEEVQSWSEEDQQEFYGVLQEMSGKPPIYVPPKHDEDDGELFTLPERER